MQFRIDGVKGYHLVRKHRDDDKFKYPWQKADREITVVSSGPCLVLRSLINREDALRLGVDSAEQAPSSRVYFILPERAPEDDELDDQQYLKTRFVDLNDTRSPVVVDFEGEGFVADNRELVFIQKYAGSRFLISSEIASLPSDLYLSGCFDPSTGNGIALISTL
ncbi:hypothetical protein KBD20_01085 [Candidatus Saccharibacteria bacterium]|nr:hypothetical protein [Candidatus Saccharibacteria bacterium]